MANVNQKLTVEKPIELQEVILDAMALMHI